MQITANGYSNHIAAGIGIVLGLFAGFAWAFQGNPIGLLLSAISAPIYQSTGLSILLVAIFILIANAVGQICLSLTLNITNRFGRNRVYDEFNSSIPEDVALHLDEEFGSLIINSSKFRYNERSKALMGMYAELATLNWSLYSSKILEHTMTQNSKKAMMSIVIFGIIPALIGSIISDNIEWETLYLVIVGLSLFVALWCLLQSYLGSLKLEIKDMYLMYIAQKLKEKSELRSNGDYVLKIDNKEE